MIRRSYTALGYSPALVHQNVYRMLERYLSHFRPSVGVPFYSKWFSDRLPRSRAASALKHRGSSSPSRIDDEISSVNQYDGVFNAFRFDALSFLLPYADINDKTCWWDSQYFTYALSKVFFGSSVMQIRGLDVMNPEHSKAYPRASEAADIFQVASKQLKEFFFNVDDYKQTNEYNDLIHLDSDATYIQNEPYFVSLASVQKRINQSSALWKNFCTNRNAALMALSKAQGTDSKNIKHLSVLNHWKSLVEHCP